MAEELNLLIRIESETGTETKQHHVSLGKNEAVLAFLVASIAVCLLDVLAYYLIMPPIPLGHTNVHCESRKDSICTLPSKPFRRSMSVSSRLAKFPAELKVSMFEHLSSVQDALSLGEISRDSRSILAEREHHIFKRLCVNQINPQLLREVLAVVQSSLLTPKTWTTEKVEAILRSYFESEAIVNQISWDRSIGSLVTRLHALVETFVKEFAFSALSKAVECNPRSVSVL